ncbi:hypothetical protein N7467_011507 [Penicillium canescens]|nr:hypothetical protein N7467_011507 [Penicillium canescens]
MASFARMVKGQVRCYSAPLDMAIPASKQRYIPTSGSYPQGFQVSGTHVGVKASNTRFPDLALIASDTPCSAAAVFTTNKFQAAPVQVSKRHCIAARGGLEDAVQMGRKVDECNGVENDSSLVMSTGVIGQRLPITKILDRIPTAHSTLASTHEAWLTTARAICTTDTFPKLLSRTFTLPSSPNLTYRLAGMTKGAGMIHPNMATLLGVVCTDAPVEAAALQPLLKHAVSRSFNSISIDGDTSTNDTIAVLANGAAGGETVRAPTSTSSPSADYTALQSVLTDFAQELSQLVVRDGEGATKFVTVRVTNSPDYESARQIASTIARSPLVKTALYGRDANWGRILCAVGYTQGVAEGTIVPERTSVSFRPVDGSAVLKLLVNGEPESVDEERASVILQNEDLEIVVDLGGGEKGDAGCGGEDAVYWFCDFSHEYVTINGDYRT